MIIIQFVKYLTKVDLWIFIVSLIITLILIIWRLDVINNFLYSHLLNGFILLLSFYLLVGTLALLSFTYLKLFNHDTEPDDPRMKKIGIFNLIISVKSLNKLVSELDSIKIQAPNEVENKISYEDEEEYKKLLNKTKEEINVFNKKFKCYKNKLLLRSGEYFFLSTLLLTLGFFFLVIDVASDYIIRPATGTEFVIFLTIISILFFIRGLLNSLIIVLLTISE